MAKKSKRPKATIKLNFQGAIGRFINRIRGISLDIANNSGVFASPSPAVSVVNGHINDLQIAQDQVETCVLGAASTRDLAYDVVWKDVYDWLGYVQGLADDAPDTAASLNIIALSGFDVRIKGVINKPALAVKTGIVPGVVKLIAKSQGRKVAYEMADERKQHGKLGQPAYNAYHQDKRCGFDIGHALYVQGESGYQGWHYAMDCGGGYCNTVGAV
jgi:hypothetical protein